MAISRAIKLCLKKFESSRLCRDTVLFNATKNSDLKEVVFEKAKINQKYGTITPPQTFSKAVDRGVKLKRLWGSMQAHKGVGGVSIDTPFVKIDEIS